MNFRSAVLEFGLKEISQELGESPMCIIEIGCMFNENEGLSTLFLGEFVNNRPGGGRFISIEYDQDHIDACKEILGKRAPHLLDKIEFYCGHSLAILPPILEDLETVNFVSQDGGAHPEVCLQEFEMLASALAPGGLILVDDAQQIEFSEVYPLPRPMGKCSFILPYLLLANYKKYREEYRDANVTIDGPNSMPASKFINQIMDLELPEIKPRDFVLLEAEHKMLAYGNALFSDQSKIFLQKWQARKSMSTLIKTIIKWFFRE